MTTNVSMLASTDPVYIPLVALSLKEMEKPIRVDGTAYIRHKKRLHLFDCLRSVGVVVPDEMNEPRMWRTRQKGSLRAALQSYFDWQ